MKNKVIETIKKYNLIDDNDKILVGVSGGPDSMCLLHVLKSLNYDVCVAHINHGLRENANVEEEYVRDYCRLNNIPFFAKHIKLKENLNGMTIEEAGRKARYDFFAEVLEKEKCTKIATAHTSNDNAETVIMNMVRGSGVNGLKGIEPIRENIIRPLIDVTRREIEEYCETNNLNPKHDESNDELLYTRNKVRLELIPYIEKNESIVISQFTLKEVIRQTIFSIADNDNNKLMTGELFEINRNELKVVSLDGHRISIRKIELREEYAPKKVVVPGKTLNEVSKILPGGADSFVTISFTSKHIVFEFENTTVVSRLIEGEYFKIDQMLSSDYETKVKINKKEFLNCIDRATLLVKEGDKKPIIINITDGSMELKINSILGSMNEDIDIEKQGKDLMIGFNPKFLIDALRVIDDEEVELYMVNPKAPCFIKNPEESYIYLILPVNFNTATN